MHYKFPRIMHINDVLPHIQEKEEFTVAERDFGTVINYSVSSTHTFDMSDINDVSGAVRRECRGLIFDKSGNIISRPFHKFFNIGERDETQPNVIDLASPHTIMEKLDGSMIRPLLFNGKIKLGTKMGLTEVAENAENWLYDQVDLESKLQFLEAMVQGNMTPIFEWVSRKNQIVLDYERDDLILLAIRNNYSGEYIGFNRHVPFNVVPTYGMVNGTISDYLAAARIKTDREGDIIRFSNGHCVKIKNDWYVRIHKMLDRIRFDRNIVALIVNEELDDAIPKLPKHELDRVKNYESSFWEAFGYKERYIHGRYDDAVMALGRDRKAIATQYIPKLEDRAVAPFIFKMLDGHRVRDLLIDHVKKNIGSNTKWEECEAWMGVKK
jgi:RNA ligase